MQSRPPGLCLSMFYTVFFRFLAYLWLIDPVVIVVIDDVPMHVATHGVSVHQSLVLRNRHLFVTVSVAAGEDNL
jgi:hypothetical protein